jgi:lipopolysaccharide heptosyltransferase I
MRVLIVKTSSLGDVLHALPALTDAARAIPGLRADWVVEKAFVEIPAWHPAVDRVIPCRLRAWRRAPLQARRSGEWSHFVEALRARPYDLVLDAQGLLKSALLARRAQGPVAGPDRHGAREALATLLYDRRIAVPSHRELHAVPRLRRLFAGALGYPLPQTSPDSALDRRRFAPAAAKPPYAVFLHGTTWATKRWDPANWIALGRWLRGEHGIEVWLPWGNDEERARAERIAGAGAGCVLPRATLSTLAGLLAGARFYVGVDTGLAHLAAALDVPGLTLYGPSLAQLTGTVGGRQLHLGGAAGDGIDRQRPLAVSEPEARAALAPLLDATH